MAVGDRRVISEALGGAISLTLTLPVWYWVGARFDRKPGRTKLTRVAFWIFVSAIAFLSLVGALVETLKSVGRNGDDVNQALPLIQKSNCGTKASLGIPSASFVGVLQRCRVEADRPLHQPFKRVRS